MLMSSSHKQRTASAALTDYRQGWTEVAFLIGKTGFLYLFNISIFFSGEMRHKATEVTFSGLNRKQPAQQ